MDPCRLNQRLSKAWSKYFFDALFAELLNLSFDSRMFVSLDIQGHWNWGSVCNWTPKNIQIKHLTWEGLTGCLGFYWLIKKSHQQLMNFNPPLEWFPPLLQVLTEHLQPAELSAAVFRLAQQALAALPFTKISHAEVGGLSGGRGGRLFFGVMPSPPNWIVRTYQGWRLIIFFDLQSQVKRGAVE